MTQLENPDDISSVEASADGSLGSVRASGSLHLKPESVDWLSIQGEVWLGGGLAGLGDRVLAPAGAHILEDLRRNLEQRAL